MGSSRCGSDSGATMATKALADHVGWEGLGRGLHNYPYLPLAKKENHNVANAPFKVTIFPTDAA